MTTWREFKYYVEEINKAIKSNNKKRFYELLKYSSKQTSIGCTSLKDELIRLVAEGINKFGEKK